MPRAGVCVWFTGLSGAGKTTIAQTVAEVVEEMGQRVTMLDGDAVRRASVVPIGFSMEERNAHVRRIGTMASEALRRGDFTICAAISPYRADRDWCRNAIGAPRFVEVFVSTPLEICELRDPKGLYARARRGELRMLTGIDAPYEAPLAPELTLDTVTCAAHENAATVVEYLRRRGFLR